MQMTEHATHAYATAAAHRSQREQEADVFRRVIGGLRIARNVNNPLQRVRALADNRRLWMAVTDLMRDPASSLPAPLRASIVSVAIAVQREMDRDSPNFDFLIEINENIVAGLADPR